MLKIYKCETCGKIVLEMIGSAVTPHCCGGPMTLLKANDTDGALEKHVPHVTKEGSTITAQIGEVEHPMLDAHYIQFITLETEKGAHTLCLKPGEKPTATFHLSENETPKAVYEYCNLHGLWVKEL